MSNVVVLLLPQDCEVCGTRKRKLQDWNGKKVCHKCILELHEEFDYVSIGKAD